jgi:hypothetical protein
LAANLALLEANAALAAEVAVELIRNQEVGRDDRLSGTPPVVARDAREEVAGR